MMDKRAVRLLKASNFLEAVVAREMNRAEGAADVAAAGSDAAIADVAGAVGLMKVAVRAKNAAQLNLQNLETSPLLKEDASL
jgi:hypothetical protein